MTELLSGKASKYTLIIAALFIMVMAVMFLSASDVSAAGDDEIAEPGHFAAKKIGLNNKAKISWSPSEGAEGYQIYRATKKHGKYKKVKQTGKNSSSYINKKLKHKAVYYYKMRAIAEKGNEKSDFTAPQKVVVKNSITGTSDVTAEELAAYFKKSGHSYPKYYKKTDAPSLKAFCQIYIDEAAAENIDVRVAFVQAMLETGWLKFGGSVSIKQHNFAGLGAVGGGVKGNKFKTVRKGVRAQIQHLKAYANKAPLKKKCVDKRFKYVPRGCAPYVEWLGIDDNPTHNGWCVGSGYGYTVVKMMNKI